MGIITRIKLFVWELSHPVANSSHYEFYQELASKHQIEVRRVYRLAHGWASQDLAESRVVDDLIRQGILRW